MTQQIAPKVDQALGQVEEIDLTATHTEGQRCPCGCGNLEFMLYLGDYVLACTVHPGRHYRDLTKKEENEFRARGEPRRNPSVYD